MASDAMRAVAYLTTDEEGSPAMLFFDKVEAATYCDEGEEPQALVLQSDALKAIEEANARAARATSLLEELHALVWGECPSLLNEDSGGNGQLDVDIRSLKESPHKS